MSQPASQKAYDEYDNGLIGHFPDFDNAVQVGQRCAEEAEADYLGAHRGTNHISSEAYCKGRYDGLGHIGTDSKKHKKDKQQVRLETEIFQQTGLQHGDKKNQNCKPRPSHFESPLRPAVLRSAAKPEPQSFFVIHYYHDHVE